MFGLAFLATPECIIALAWHARCSLFSWTRPRNPSAVRVWRLCPHFGLDLAHLFYVVVVSLDLAHLFYVVVVSLDVREACSRLFSPGLPLPFWGAAPCWPGWRLHYAYALRTGFRDASAFACFGASLVQLSDFGCQRAAAVQPDPADMVCIIARASSWGTLYGSCTSLVLLRVYLLYASVCNDLGLGFLSTYQAAVAVPFACGALFLRYSRVQARSFFGCCASHSAYCRGPSFSLPGLWGRSPC